MSGRRGQAEGARGTYDTTLDDTEQDADGDELAEVGDEGRADGDDTKGNTEEGEPHGADLLEDQVRGNLAEDVKDVENHEGDVVVVLGHRQVEVLREAGDIGIADSLRTEERVRVESGGRAARGKSAQNGR